MVTKRVTGSLYIIAKALNKQNTSKLLLFKLYFKVILKMILKSFDFQCEFDFQITTPKMILILNHLYLGDLILILNHLYLSYLILIFQNHQHYDDFAHL